MSEIEVIFDYEADCDWPKFCDCRECEERTRSADVDTERR